MEQSERGRVLFTGNGDNLIDNLIQHAASEFKMVKCKAKEADFKAALARVKPHTLVLCLSQESGSDLEMYKLLEEGGEYSGLLCIAIGKQDDCDFFKERINLENLAVFYRPVNVEQIQEAIARNVKAAMPPPAIKGDKEAAAATHTVQKSRTSVRVDVSALSEAAARDTAKHPARPSAGGNIPGRTGEDIESHLEDFVWNTPLFEKRFTILVVDDDVRMLNTIKIFLQDLYDVAAVPSGKLALMYLEKKHADLVLLDYLMPDMDGTEVLYQIRTNSKHRDVPVLFLTGVAERDMVVKGISMRPNGYLLKPVDRKTLLERVTGHLLELF